MTTIFRVEKNSNYVVMSNHHLRNREMSLKAKGLLSLILSLPPEWNYSLTGLCAICKESQTAMRSALKELENHNYLVRNRRKNSLGHFEYEYIVYEVPYTGNQHADNQHTQKEHTEKRTQINKEKLSKDKLNIDGVNKEKEINNILISSVHDQELFELYKDYIQMREEMDAPLTPKGLQMLIKRCERLSKNNIRVQRLLLENSLLNGWKNVFLPTETEIELASNETRADLKELFGLDQGKWCGKGLKCLRSNPRAFQAYMSFVNF